MSVLKLSPLMADYRVWQRKSIDFWTLRPQIALQPENLLIAL